MWSPCCLKFSSIMDFKCSSHKRVKRTGRWPRWWSHKWGLQFRSPAPHQKKKKLAGVWQPAWNPRSQKAETGHPREEWLSRPAKSAQLQSQSEPASINDMKNDWGTQRRPTSDLHTHAHTCTIACISYVQTHVRMWESGGLNEGYF